MSRRDAPSRRRRRRLSLSFGPAPRLALGLALMSVCLFMGLDLATGLVADPGVQAARLRGLQAEFLADRVSQALGRAQREGRGDDALVGENGVGDGGLQRLLHEARAAEPEILTLALRRADGSVVAGSGDWLRLPAFVSDDRSTLDRVLVPIVRNQARWGRLEVLYQPAYPRTWVGWLTMPISLTVLGLVVIGVPLYGLYLRRALQLLDPSSAVPGRVRAAFDTLAEGVVVLDKDGRVVLVNEIFHAMMPDRKEDVLGAPLAEMSWLIEAMDWAGPTAPWTRAMAEGRAVDNVGVQLPGRAGVVRRFVLRANPISDPSGGRRGCILTFDDVSALYQSNQRLSDALVTLEASKAQVQEQNAALERLASRDPLTDCLNRRAFYQAAAKLWAEAGPAARSLTLAMCDIDHFKQVNDRYGHASGDTVIKATADWLRAVTTDEDLVCRMGGEEFCVVWRRLPPDQGMARAEALRRLAEEATLVAEDGRSIRVTLSVGVMIERAADHPIEILIEQADQALYEAKRGGRNRVRRGSVTPAASAEASSAILL